MGDIALITGASSGLGVGIAKVLAAKVLARCHNVIIMFPKMC